MEKCKNIECENKTTNKRIYCSLSCRSYYSNKYLKNYEKNKNYAKNKKNDLKQEYYKNPKTCLNPKCDKIIDFDKKRNKYCNSSCSAKHINTIRECKEYKKLSGKALENVTKANMERNGYIFTGILRMVNCKNDNCVKKIEAKKRRKYCSEECKKEFNRKNLSEYQKYKSDCSFKFGLKDYKDEFEFELIEKYGWYKAKNRGDNLDGISRDHMYSIKEGFKNNIDSYLISHPANCELLQQKKNSSKYVSCSITIEELKEKINKWEEKYK